MTERKLSNAAKANIAAFESAIGVKVSVVDPPPATSAVKLLADDPAPLIAALRARYNLTHEQAQEFVMHMDNEVRGALG